MIRAGVLDILQTGRLINGSYSKRLEAEFARLTGTTHAVAINSCTAALQTCLSYFGAKDGEVLVPAAAFTTDLSACRWIGAKPVLVDINRNTLSFDLDDLGRKLTPQTKGIIWIHLTGLISEDAAEIVAFARRHNLFVLEDCAHAQGALVNGRPAGSIGDAGCFSFYPTKLMTCGVGGMITTNDPALDRYARQMRFFGRSVETGEVEIEGSDLLLDEFRSCIALAQLNEFDAALLRRRELAAVYCKALANQPALTLVSHPDFIEHAYYQFPVFLRDRAFAKAVGNALRDKHGIQAKQIYKPVYEEEIFREYDDRTFHATEDLLHRSLCLPLHQGMSNDDVESVSAALIQEIRDRL